MNLQEIRQKYPEYSDMPDADFTQKFHQKFYSDMSFDDFSKKIGYSGQSSLVDQIPGGAPKSAYTPEPEYSTMDKIKGAGEAGLNLLSGLTTGTLGGAVEGAQGILNSALDGTFGTQEGRKGAEEQFMKGMEMGTYQPHTEAGKQYSEVVGQGMQQLLPLAGLMPQMEAMASAKLPPRVSTQPTKKPMSSMEKVMAEDQAKQQAPQQPAKMPTQQPELDLGQPNQFGMRPSEFVKDENGIPIKRDASLEAQTTERGGDLFSAENLQRESVNEAVNNWKPNEEALRQASPDREYLKQQEIEQAYLQREKELVSQVDDLASLEDQTRSALGQSQFGKSQRGSANFGEIVDGFKEIARKLSASDLDLSIVKGLPENLYNKSEQWLRDYTSNPTVATAVVKDNTGKVVGFADMAEHPSKQGQLEIAMIRVNPEYQRQGIGTEMIRSIEDSGFKIAESAKSTPEGQAFQKQVLGQTGFGKGQRGSIGVRKDPFEVFSKQVKQNYPDATPEQIQRAWEYEKQGASNAEKAVTVSPEQKAISKIPAFKKTVDIWDDISKEDAVSSIRTSEDAQVSTLGATAKTILQRGRLGFENFPTQGVRAGVGHLVTLRDNAKIAANKILNDVEGGVLTAARKMESIFGAGQAGEVFRQLQEAQFNPEYQFKLNGQQQKLLEKVQGTLKQSFDDMYNTLAKVDQVAAEKLKSMKIDNYFPSLFFGDFVATVRDSGGRVVYYIAESNKRAAHQAVQYLRQNLGEGFTVDPYQYVGSASRSLTSKQLKAIEGSSIQEAFGNKLSMMLDLLGSDDISTQKVADTVARMKQKAAMNTEQVQNRMKYKAGIKGELGNKPWKTERENYYDAKDVLEGYVRSVQDWKSAMEASQFMKEIRGIEGKENTFSLLSEQFDIIHGNTSKTIENTLVKAMEKAFTDIPYQPFSPKVFGKAATNMANGLTKMMLGAGNLVMVAQNVLQGASTFVPKAAQIWARGQADLSPMFSSMIIGHLEGLMDTIGQAKNDAFTKYKIEHEISDPQLLASHQKTKAGNFADQVISFNIKASEEFSRSAFFNSMVRYLKSSGMEEKMAWEQAKNMTKDYMGNMEDYARAGVFSETGTAGKLMGRLQSYRTLSLSLVKNYLDEVKISNPKSIAPIATYLYISYLTAGLVGNVAMDLLEGVYTLAIGMGMDPKIPSPRQYVLKELPDYALGTLSEVTNFGLFNSFGSNIVGDLSRPGGNIAPIPSAMVNVASQVPTLFGMAKEKVTGEHSIPDYKKAQALSAVVPTVARGKIEENLLTDKEGRIRSQFTGKTMHQKSPNEPEFMNVRSKERAEKSLRNSLESKQERRIDEKVKGIVSDLQALVDDSVRTGKAVSKEVLNDKLNKVIEYTGDPKKAINSLTKLAVDNQIADPLIRGIINKQTNPIKKQALIREYNMQRQRYPE